MSIFEAVILGIVQGLTEFLPVSSSGHLVVVQRLLGLKEPLIAFDVAVHFGTLMAVFVYFHRDIQAMIQETLEFIFRFVKEKNRKNLLDEYPMALTTSLILLATIPTGAIAIAFKDSFEALFASVPAVGIAWLITGAFLILSRKFQSGSRTLYEMNHQDAFIIGIVQGIAIIPGISRAGSTILTGMGMGIEKKDAARFSFLMSIPAILAATLLELKDAAAFYQQYPLALIAGFAASAVVGYLTIFFLLRLIARGSFYLFGFYCLAAGLFALAISFFS